MRTAARHDGMLQVHCEEPSIIEPLVETALRDHLTGCRHHALTRPPHAEARPRPARRSRWRAGPMPRCTSSISAARRRSMPSPRPRPGRAGLCGDVPPLPHLHRSALRRSGRARGHQARHLAAAATAGDVDALWVGLRDGVLDVVGSDHVPDRLDTEKAVPAPPFPQISNGGPGIETLLSLVYSAGVAFPPHQHRSAGRGRSPPPRHACSACRPRGRSRSGRDADLVLLDPDAQHEIRQADLSHTSDYTPYEGMPVIGAIREVLVRGRSPGDAPGRFLERRLK